MFSTFRDGSSLQIIQNHAVDPTVDLVDFWLTV